ncbi:MAG: ABC transporter permease subunit, partial [Chloroflexi bacterium]|nr:ABC transporter permease subunit [Chloroflexota bacterium]
MTSNRPSFLALLGQHFILILMAIFVIYPVWFVVLASLRPGDRLLTLDLISMFVPTVVTFENYRIMLVEEPFLIWFRNSLFVAGFTTIACLLIATSAAFAFSRFEFVGRRMGLILFLALQAFPGVLALVPIAQILSAFGLYRNHWGLILAYVSGVLVFTTWNMKGFFDTLPKEIEEAAMIDGCGPIQSFVRVALPLARPAIAVTALFGFMAGWGEFALASVLIPAPDEKKTLMVALFRLANNIDTP